MKFFVMALVFLGLLTGAAAQIAGSGSIGTIGPTFHRRDSTGGMGLGGGGGSAPVVCSNKLDFSDQCNSQYIGVVQ